MKSNLLAAGFLVSALALFGCAKTTATPLSRNMVQISTSTAPVCGSSGAQSLAVQAASIETLRRGFDGYIIVGSQRQNNVGVVGYTPMYANTNYNAFGNTITGTTTFSGGDAIIGGTHDQDFIIQMFKRGEAGFANAVDARSALGPDWHAIASKGFASDCAS